MRARKIEEPTGFVHTVTSRPELGSPVKTTIDTEYPMLRRVTPNTGDRRRPQAAAIGAPMPRRTTDGRS